MNEYIYQKQLEEGYKNLPPISYSVQVAARRKKLITYSKIGRHVVYKREWVEEFIENNIRKAQPKAY